MGSGGSERKGRRHLAKAGTKTDLEQMHHQQRREIAHNVGLDPHDRSGGGRTLTYILIAVATGIVVIAAITVWLFT